MELQQLFVEDHRHCEALLDALRDHVRRGHIVDAWRGCVSLRLTLENHLEAEEEELFPCFERVTGITHGTTDLMLAEHGRMRELMNQMAGALGAGDCEAAMDRIASLEALLAQHSRKEEYLVYTVCASPEADLGALERALRHHWHRTPTQGSDSPRQ